MELLKRYQEEAANVPAAFLAEHAHKHLHGGQHADCARMPMLEQLRFKAVNVLTTYTETFSLVRISNQDWQELRNEGRIPKNRTNSIYLYSAHFDERFDLVRLIVTYPVKFTKLLLSKFWQHFRALWSAAQICTVNFGTTTRSLRLQFELAIITC